MIIPARFNGPTASGHGGYSTGLAASAVGGTAEVSLRRPPPLERPLRLQSGDAGSMLLLDGDAVVAEARPAGPLGVELPEAVTLAEAQEAAAAFPWIAGHPFPRCYACGPEREEGDGLRQFPGPVAGREATYATPFVTPRELAGENGLLTDLGLWACLDCPTGVVVAEAQVGSPCVLARLAVERLGPVAAGETHIVVSRFLAQEGRKIHTTAALFDTEGTALAVARALWVALTPEQAAAMSG